MTGELREFLELCGFQEKEMAEEAPRVEKAFDILELGPADLDRGRERIHEYWDVELLAIRKSLGMWIKELVDLVLSKGEGKKVVFTSYPPNIVTTTALATAWPDVLYCGYPELILDLTIGQIFDRINPILEEAERSGLPPGRANCSLIQARVGAIAKGYIPTPDLLVPSSFFCDQEPNADEFLHEVYGVPVLFEDGPMDSLGVEYPDVDERRIEYKAQETANLRQGIKDLLGFDVRDEDMMEGLKLNVLHRLALEDIWNYCLTKDPSPVSALDLHFAAWASVAILNRIKQEGTAILNGLNKEIRKRGKADQVGKKTAPGGAPRVLAWYCSFVDPKIFRMVEHDAGLRIIASSLLFPMTRAAADRTYQDPNHMTAYLLTRRGIWHSHLGHIKHAYEICESYKPDGYLNMFLFSCRPSALSCHMVKNEIETKLGIPVLTLEYDMYDTRDFSAESFRTRIETFAEMLRARGEAGTAIQ